MGGCSLDILAELPPELSRHVAMVLPVPGGGRPRP